MPDSDASVTPLQGKTTIDDKMFFEPERLSYECAVAIAEEIAEEVNPVPEKTVVIAGTQLLGDFANLQATYTMLDALKRDYEGLAKLGRELTAPGSLEFADESGGFEAVMIPAAMTAAIAPVTTLVNAALGLVGMFREDVEYHGIKTTVDPLAFEITLASHLKQLAKDKTVIVPDLKVESTVLTTKNSLSVRLANVQTAKNAAWKLLAPLVTELAQLEADLDRVARDGTQAEFDRISMAISNLRQAMQPISEPLARCDQQLADIRRAWDKRDESSGLSELARLLRAETILASDAAYLHAKVVSSGGHHRITRSLWRTLFFGDGLSFAGGATVRWALLSKTGEVLKGGIIVKRANDST